MPRRGKKDPATRATGRVADEPRQRPARVLIVDDDPDARSWIRAGLERSPHFEVVAEATGGREGISRAALWRPDLVILDVDMPPLGGIEALPSIKRASPNSKVVFFSGRPRGADLPGGPAWQTTPYIEKDDDWPHVIQKLASVMFDPVPGPSRSAP